MTSETAEEKMRDMNLIKGAEVSSVAAVHTPPRLNSNIYAGLTSIFRISAFFSSNAIFNTA